MDTDQPRHLFLDLENTVITPVVPDWDSVELININKIKGFMEQWRPTCLNIFSFAVHGAEDLLAFRRAVAPRIEQALGMPLNLVPQTQTDIFRQCGRLRNTPKEQLSHVNARNFWGKQDAFRLYARAVFGNPSRRVAVALLDDEVVDENFGFPGMALEGTIRNIDGMPEMRGSFRPR